MVDAGDDLIGRRDAGHADVGAVYVGRIVEHVLEQTAVEADRTPAVDEVRGVGRCRDEASGALSQTDIVSVERHVLGVLADQRHGARGVDGRSLDPQVPRPVHDDARTAAVVAEGAFVGVDRAHGRQFRGEESRQPHGVGAEHRGRQFPLPVGMEEAGRVVIGGMGKGVENDVVALGLLPAVAREDQLPVLDPHGVSAGDFQVDTACRGVLCDHAAFQHERHVVVDRDAPEGDLLAAVDVEGNQFAVETELGVVPADGDTAHSLHAEGDAFGSVVVVRHAQELLFGLLGIEVVDAGSEFQRKPAFGVCTEDLPHVCGVVGPAVERDADVRGSRFAALREERQQAGEDRGQSFRIHSSDVICR